MAKQTEADREYRRDMRTQSIAYDMLPAKHLSVWGRCRYEVDDEVSPSEVWRALMFDARMRYDPMTSIFHLTNNETKEGNA